MNVTFAAFAGLWGVLVIDMIQFFMKMSAVIAAAYFAVTSPQVGGLHALVDEGVGHARAGRARLPGPAAGLQQQLGPGRRGVHHADRGAVVGGVVPGCGAGRRELHRAAHAGVEVGEGRAQRRPLLQLRPLRAAAVAVDPRRALLAHRLPGAVGHPARVSQSRPAAARPRHRVSGDADVPAGRLPRPDGRRPDRRELVDDPHAPQLGRVVPRARFLPAVRQAGRRRAALRAGRPHRHRGPVRGRRGRRCICSTPRRTSST